MDSLIVKPDGFLQPKLPTKKEMIKMTNDATMLARQGADIINELLIERRTMDLLVDDVLLGKPGAAESVMTARKGRLEI